MKRKKWGGLLTFSLLFFFFLLLPWKASLCVRDRHGSLLAFYNLGRERSFSVTFLHSVNRGLVKELYRVDSDLASFYLESAWFENYGAGMLDIVPEDAVMSDDGGFLKVDFPKRRMSSVCYAAAGIANHTLTVNSEEVSLYRLHPFKTSMITIEKMSIFDQIFKR